jgi:hypothetical protein
MQPDLHVRARMLVDRAALDALSPEEERWLEGHIAACAECSHYAELSRRAIGALDHFAFDLDPEAAIRVQQAVHSRVAESAAAPAWIGPAVAIALTIAGSLAVWQPAAWLATRWNLPSPEWQAGFVLFWLLPSLILDLLVIFRAEIFS